MSALLHEEAVQLTLTSSQTLAVQAGVTICQRSACWATIGRTETLAKTGCPRHSLAGAVIGAAGGSRLRHPSQHQTLEGAEPVRAERDLIGSDKSISETTVPEARIGRQDRAAPDSGQTSYKAPADCWDMGASSPAAIRRANGLSASSPPRGCF